MTEELFRSADLLVRQVAPQGGGVCVVTFDSFTDYRTLDRPGFGESFLRDVGVDAIHVIARDNDWYSYPEMAEALARVHAATRCHARVVSYGSSMGAYAAIRFAGLVGAHAVLALSPQFSIDPAVTPFETRWAECSRHFQGRWERALELPQIPEAYIVYDPVNRDRWHIGLFERAFAFQAIRIPYAGHPVTGYLAEIGLLQEAILTLARGTFDRAALEREARQRRRQSAQYLLFLAEGMPSRRRGQRIALIRQAVGLAPDNVGVMCRLGVELAMAGEFEEALAMHRRTLVLSPGHPNMMLHYSYSLELSGDLDAALALAEELYRITEASPVYRPRLEEMRARIAARDAPPPPPLPLPISPPRRNRLWRWLRKGLRWSSFRRRGPTGA